MSSGTAGFIASVLVSRGKVGILYGETTEKVFEAAKAFSVIRRMLFVEKRSRSMFVAAATQP